MTLAQLNAKIDALPSWGVDKLNRVEARYLCDERLAILCGAAEPTEAQVDMVNAQLFPDEAQRELL